MYNIRLQKKVLKFLDKHKGEKIIELFTISLKILQNNPYNNRLDIKLLIGYKNKFRLRIGQYRFIYEIFEEQLIITFINGDNRGNIYK